MPAGHVKKAKTIWIQIPTLIQKFLKVKMQLKAETFLWRLMDKQLGKKILGLCFYTKLSSKMEKFDNTHNRAVMELKEMSK